ncbi:Hydrophobin [Pleurotus pulmonarius]
MFSIRISTVVLAASALLAVASPITNTEIPGSQCSTGTIQCCSSSSTAGNLSGLASALLSGSNAVLTCSPLSVVELNANSCSGQVACCTGNTFNTLISLACSPINVGL